MKRFQVVAAAFHALLGTVDARHQLSAELIAQTDARWRRIRETLPLADELALDPTIDTPPLRDPWQELTVELTDDGRLLRVLDAPLTELVTERLREIDEAVLRALEQYAVAVAKITSLIGLWMTTGQIVHVIGAGRALLAASLPANRLAHGGANVYILGDKAPPPNSRFGGAIIAASASGATPSVLEIMSFAHNINRYRSDHEQITIIGVSKPNAAKVGSFELFPNLCSADCFIGISVPDTVRLRGLGDLEELAIAHLLDALVVAAGLQVGANFRAGHEDLVGGATGPWHQHGVARSA